MPPGVLAAMPAAPTVPQTQLFPQGSEGTPTLVQEGSHNLYLPLVLKRACLVKIIAYTGPSNVDYGPGVELPCGIELTPVGRYSDFVKVQWRDEGRNLQEGFVGRQFLVNVDIESLPLLTKEDVPWIEERYITPERPITFVSTGFYDNEFKTYQIQGSVMEVREDMTINIEIEDVLFDANAPESSAIEILLDNGVFDQGVKKLILTYYKGGPPKGWSFGYLPLGGRTEEGDHWEFFDNSGIYDPRGKFAFQIDKVGRTVKLTLPNGQEKIYNLQTPLYADSRVLGMSVIVWPQSGVEIPSLSRFEAPTGEWRDVSSEESLRSLADKAGITIGSAVVPLVYPYDLAYQGLSSNEFNSMTPDGPFHWTWLLRPGPNQFNFALADLQVEFGRKHNMRLCGQALVDGAVPDWLRYGSYAREELIQIMEDHISAVVGRYKGRVNEWVVVNEALWDGNFVENFWYQNIGPEYIEIALRAAGEADPDAVLILNFDRNEEINRQSDGIYNLIADLKLRGVPVDGVGMEMHLFATDPPDKESVVANMRRFGELGVKVYITELDVNLYGVEGTPEEKMTVQARIYRDMLEACLESGACESYTMWGFMLPYSWLLGPDYAYGPAETYLLFDEDGNPNESYFAIRDALRAAASQP
jgi:endo-1,4-beta-xylanase